MNGPFNSLSRDDEMASSEATYLPGSLLAFSDIPPFLAASGDASTPRTYFRREGKALREVEETANQARAGRGLDLPRITPNFHPNPNIQDFDRPKSLLEQALDSRVRVRICATCASRANEHVRKRACA